MRKNEKDETEKLFGERYIVHESEDSYSINLACNISKWISIRFLTTGILLALAGSILTTIFYFIKSIYISISLLILSLGLGIIITSVFTILKNRRDDLIKLREVTKIQCYAWLLGAYISVRNFIKQSIDEQKKNELNLENALNILNIGSRLDKSKDIVEQVKDINDMLGHENYADDFFHGGLDAMLLIYDRSPNIAPLLSTTEKKETEHIYFNKIGKLGYYNNPVITRSFIDRLLHKIEKNDIDDAFDLVLSVKHLYEMWINNSLHK